MFMSPLFVYVGFRSYVLHGGFGWTSNRRCVGCGKTWYHSHDGWGFMSFGKNKPKWYQTRVCETPKRCDIVGEHEVKWVSDEPNNK